MRVVGLLVLLAAAASCRYGFNDRASDAAVGDVPKDAVVVVPATLEISPLTTDFGSVTVGQTSTVTTFTVTNTGTSTSDQVLVAFTGTTTDYHIAANTCQVLAPAATCTVGVAFGPLAPGARPASLTAHVFGNTASALLAGTGTLPGNLAVSPSTYAFSDAVLGTPMAEVDTITIRNTGTLPSGTLSVQATGSDPGEFTKATDTCSGQILAASATCTLGIQFTPTTAGAKSAGFAVIGNPGGTTTSIITATAIAPARLTVVPETLDFGSVVQSATSTNATISVANGGGTPTGAITTTITGAAASAFAVAASNCGTLAALASCTIVLRYTPSALGTQAATLTVAGTPGGSVTTSLRGTGVVSGQLTITPTTQAFANTLVGATTATTTFTITNTAGTSAGPLSVQFTGTNAGEFQLGSSGSTCPNAVVPPASTCTVTVRFAPTSVGAKTASLLVTGGGTISASLSGNGLPQAALAISPSTKDFGSVGIGNTSTAQLFTVTNVGGAATTVPSVTLGGTDPGQFTQTTNCTAALAPAATCTVSVVFQPTTSALDSAQLGVTAATGGTVTASLFGQGQNPAQIAVLPSSLTFTATVGDVSPVQTFLVRNDGSVTTGPIAIAFGGAGTEQFSQTSTCTTLAAGATCAVSVTFAPTIAGNQAATATVSATPGGSATVALAGTARARIEIVSINSQPPTSPFDFGTQFIGTTTTAAIVLRNNTSGPAAVTKTPTFPTPVQYAIDSACPSIAPGASCTVTASFAPTSVGTKLGSVSFVIGNGTANQVAVSFAGAGQSSIALTPVTAANFGNVVVGQTSPTLAFTVTNVSTLASGAITTNVLSAPFSQSAATTCGASLAPAGTCTVAAVFNPTTLGLTSTTIIVTAASGGVATIDLSGTGVSATDLQLNPAPTSFGTVFAGATKDITVVVTNPAGSQTAGPMTFGLSGASELAILNNNSAGDCVTGTTALPNGQTCNIRLRFSPVVFDDAGTRLDSGVLTVTASPGAVSGITSAVSGVATSTISISPPTFDFGKRALNTPTVSQTFTVHNDSPTTTVIGMAHFAGTSTNLSITLDTCSSTNLLANANCTVTVTFNPTIDALVNATLTVPTTDGFGRGVATLFGTSGNPHPGGANWTTIANGTVLGTAAIANVNTSPQQMSFNATGVATVQSALGGPLAIGTVYPGGGFILGCTSSTPGSSVVTLTVTTNVTARTLNLAPTGAPAGWYASTDGGTTAFHGCGNSNYFVGFASGLGQLNDYFVFDLSTVPSSETVLGVSLRAVEGCGSPPTATWTAHLFSTNPTAIASLEACQSN